MLVCTTVIEVGVDVPNATVMLVMDAERFGISRRHQLRGRIGRGAHPSLCLLASWTSPGSRAGRRLSAVAETMDGFVLADLDLKERREGDVLGRNQSGKATLGGSCRWLTTRCSSRPLGTSARPHTKIGRRTPDWL